MRSQTLTTKKNWIVTILFTISILLSGCKKEAMEPNLVNPAKTDFRVGSPGSTDFSNVQPRCENSVILYAGQFYNVGSFNYVNGNSGTVDFTYYVKSPWKITDVHLYVGDCASIPLNQSGNTIPGLYPFQKIIGSSGSDSVSFKIPNKDLPNCGCIAAHAKVSNSLTGAVESAWAEGTRFTFTNWDMHFPYCLASCNPANQGCVYPLAYWYLEINYSKLPGQIAIGNYNYSPEEIYTLWQKHDVDNLADSRYCLIQVATIKLSQSKVASGADILSDVTICENYLNGLGQKISPNYMPSGDTAARNAANNIANWIRTHACNN